jgi:hypothetical protein
MEGDGSFFDGQVDAVERFKKEGNENADAKDVEERINRDGVDRVVVGALESEE